MKLRNTYYIAVMAGLLPLGLFSGCKSSQAGRLSVEPQPLVLTPDSNRNVQVDVTLNVPKRAFSKRSRLIVMPQLVAGDSVWAECSPIVLDASVYRKKMERREQLWGYQDSLAGQAQPIKRRKAYAIPYQESVPLNDTLNNARLIAVITSDGCGDCSTLDTLHMADISNPATLIDKEELKLNWMEPLFVIRPKVMEARGEARLQFKINRYDIDLTLANNQQEMEEMLARLKEVASDTLATLNSVSIEGVASVDGSLAFNTTLAKNRARSAQQWLFSQFNFTATQKKVFTIGSKPEGWTPVLEAMKADGHPDTLQVNRILKKYEGKSDDYAEREIRRLACWKDIRAKYLASDRKVEYVYTYTLRSFTTDEELLRMYESRPDAFNEEELLRVSTLKQSDAEKQEVYRTILHYFPQSQVAANNLAILLMREGKSQEAEAIIHSLDNYSPEVINTQAALYAYRHDYERAIELLDNQAVDSLSEARYNLGLLKARTRQMDEAYRLLEGYNEVSTAVVALSLNRNDEAASIMQKVEEQTPLAEYVRSLTAARLQQDDEFFAHIANACADPALKQRAADEADFKRYATDQRFRALIKE